MAKGLSATQRTLRLLRQQGLVCDIAEKWNPFGGPPKPGGGRVGIRKDLFGFIDIIALDPQRGIVAVQSCGQSFAAHLKKILEERAEEVIAWLECQGKLDLYGWRKVKIKRGGKAMRWMPRIQEITLEDFK